MNINEFKKEIEKLNIEFSDKEIDALEKYYEELISFNSHTNLTTIVKKEDVYLKHFYDSLTIVKELDLTKVKNIIDVGTGAGFPGIVLKIFFPNINLYLLDSNNKKIKFLTEIVEKLQLKDVTIINDRIENYSKKMINYFDVVTARAVKNLRVLSELVLPLIKNNGLFIALKGNSSLELEEAKETIELMGANLKKINNFKLFNESDDRSIIVIDKKRDTQLEEIRTYDRILKKPLQKKNK